MVASAAGKTDHGSRATKTKPSSNELAHTARVAAKSSKVKEVDLFLDATPKILESDEPELKEEMRV